MGATCQMMKSQNLDNMKKIFFDLAFHVHICSNHNLYSWKKFYKRKIPSSLIKKLYGCYATCQMMKYRDLDNMKKIFFHLAVVALNSVIIIYIYILTMNWIQMSWRKTIVL